MCLDKPVVLEPGLNRSVCKLPRIPGEQCNRLHILSDIPLKLLVCNILVMTPNPHHQSEQPGPGPMHSASGSYPVEDRKQLPHYQLGIQKHFSSTISCFDQFN